MYSYSKALVNTRGLFICAWISCINCISECITRNLTDDLISYGGFSLTLCQSVRNIMQWFFPSSKIKLGNHVRKGGSLMTYNLDGSRVFSLYN